MKKLINKKTILSILLVVIMVFSVACSNSEAPEEADDEPADVETTEPATETEPDEASDQKGTALEDGVLDLGTNAAFPPYEYYEGEEIVGIDPEIAQAVADYLGYELKIHDMEFANIIASIESGKVDGGIAGMTVSDERLESVNFSNSYATGVQSIIVTLDSDIETVEDLEGKKIGTQFGTTGDIYTQDDFGMENVQSFDKGADAIVALLSGNVDCVVIDNEPAKSFAETDENLVILDTEYAVEDYAIAITKDNEALLEEINTALTALKESGDLQKIIDKYITVD